MNELYWITRLDAINQTFVFILVVSVMIGIIASFLAFVYPQIEDEEIPGIKKVAKGFIASSIISCLFCIFIPSKKDAFIIWGIGGTIDYIKSNDTAKQLPDKVIYILDKWVDTFDIVEEENRTTD